MLCIDMFNKAKLKKHKKKLTVCDFVSILFLINYLVRLSKNIRMM